MIYELKNTLQHLDRFIGHYPIYIYLTDAQDKVVWLNRYMAEKIKDIHIGQEVVCANLLDPCTEPCAHCGKNLTDEKGQFEKTTFRGKTDDNGQCTYLEFFKFPIYGVNHTTEGSLRIGIDVSKSEQLEEQLREKEKLFKAIVDTSTDAVIFLDRNQRVRNWNKGAEEIFGYTAEEILGKSIELLLPDELVELGELGYLQSEVDSKGYVKKYETQRLCKDGRLIYVDISRSRVTDQSGNLIGTSEIIKDITSRKELEFELLRTILELSKLNELNEILHHTFDEMEILRIILIAITAGEGLRFNRAFIMMSDHERNILKGHLAIGPSDENEASRIWSELNQDYHYLKDIVQIYKIDLEGTDRKVNEIVSKIEVPLDADDHILIAALKNRRVFEVNNGQVVGSDQPFSFAIGDTDLFSLLNDNTFVVAPVFSRIESLGVIIADNCIIRREITSEDIEGLKLFANQAGSALENARLYRDLEDRIAALQEANRQLAEKTEQLLKAERLAVIGEMSAKIAHEIRNPLVSIGGFARLIERKVGDSGPLKQYAGIIREQVSNLEHILNNLLTAASQPEPQFKRMDLRETVRSVIQTMETAVFERGIRLISQIAEAPVEIHGDPKMLYQAVLNLLKNAMEALEGKSNGEIRLAVRQTGQRAQIQISDNGPGIETQVIPKIFQKFFTTKSQGTGLGLSIVHQIVEMHQGEIKLDTNPESGTTFLLDFPLAGNPTGESE